MPCHTLCAYNTAACTRLVDYRIFGEIGLCLKHKLRCGTNVYGGVGVGKALLYTHARATVRTAVLSRFELCLCVAVYLIWAHKSFSLGGSRLHSLRFVAFSPPLFFPLDRSDWSKQSVHGFKAKPHTRNLCFTGGLFYCPLA